MQGMGRLLVPLRFFLLRARLEAFLLCLNLPIGIANFFVFLNAGGAGIGSPSCHAFSAASCCLVVLDCGKFYLLVFAIIRLVLFPVPT